MAYAMTSISAVEWVMGYVPPPPPPPPPVNISITFNVKFQWNHCEQLIITNALEKLIMTTEFMKRFPLDITHLQIQIITTLHRDKVQDRADHINCRFYWNKANGENNRLVDSDVSHLYFNENHTKIWQITETKYTLQRF